MTQFTIKPKLQTALCLGSVLLAFACSSGNQTTSETDPASTAAGSADESAQAVASNFRATSHDECDQDDGCPSDDGDDMGHDDQADAGDDMDDDGDDMNDGDDCDRDDGCPDDDDDVGQDDDMDAGTPGTPVEPDGSLGSCGSDEPKADAGAGDAG